MASTAIYRALLDIIDGSYFDASANSDANRRVTKLGTLDVTLVGQDGTAGHTAYGSGDKAFILKMGPGNTGLQSYFVPDTINAGGYNNWFRLFNEWLASLKNGLYTDVATLLAYMNTQAANSGTVGPGCAYLYWLYISGGTKAGSFLLPAANVFAPQTFYSASSVGAGGAITPGLTGNTILTANNVPAALQGYLAAPGVQATASVAINGTLSVHVTYSGTNAAGAAIAAQVGTLVLDNLPAGSTTAAGAWTPATAGDRISAVTAVAYLSGTATAGAFSLQSVLERITS